MDDPALKAPRVPWTARFPEVVTHTTVRLRDAHPGYHAAKSGDAEAALDLAEALVDRHAIARLRVTIDNRPILVLPVIADETFGFNAIPDAVAQVVGRKLDLEVIAGEIVQTNKVGHTRAPAFQRMVTPAEFEGRVQPGTTYLLVDDHIGLGGTLANLRGYIETHGGWVDGITTLTESRQARHISLRTETLAMLKAKHGQELDDFWKSALGHGIDCLTEVEAQILCREPTVAAIEDFLAKATIEARSRGIQPALEADRQELDRDQDLGMER